MRRSHLTVTPNCVGWDTYRNAFGSVSSEYLVVTSIITTKHQYLPLEKSRWGITLPNESRNEVRIEESVAECPVLDGGRQVYPAI